MSFRKQLLGETFIYGISRYASLFAALFLTPIYTRLLSKADYGVMDIFNRWNAFAISILPLGLFTAYLRFYPDAKKESQSAVNLLNGTILMTIFGACIAYGLLMTLILPLFYAGFVDETFPGIDRIYWMSIVIVFGQLYFQYHLQSFRVNFQKYSYAILSLVNFLILTILGFYFVYFKDLNIIGFFYASVISVIASSLIASYMNRNILSLQFDLKEAKKLLRYSIHFLSVFFLFQITDLVDRYLIKNVISIEDVGIYSIGSRIAGVLQIGLGAFATAWMPHALGLKDDPSANRIFSQGWTAYMLIGTFVVSGIILFRPELLLFFAPDYAESSFVIVLLCLFNFIMGMAYTFSLGIQLSKRTAVISKIGIVVIGVKVILSVLLVGPYGINGIAMASLIESFCWIGVQHYFSQKYFPLKYPYIVLVISTLLLVSVILFSEYMSPSLQSLPFRMLFSIGLTAIMFVLVKYFIINRGSLSVLNNDSENEEHGGG